MIIKVCGMTDQANLDQLVTLEPDWFGMIFYERSPRYIGDTVLSSSKSVSRIGVFVNSGLKEVMQNVHKFRLDGVQLHGEESASMCQLLQKEGLLVLKAISIAGTEDILSCGDFEGKVDYLLFDTKSSHRGGSGRSFDWSILDAYVGQTPFLLAGGIGLHSLPTLTAFSHPRWVGVDLNSRFELSAGYKNIEDLKLFMDAFRGG